MFCSKCGKAMKQGMRFCTGCGAPASAAPAPPARTAAAPPVPAQPPDWPAWDELGVTADGDAAPQQSSYLDAISSTPYEKLKASDTAAPPAKKALLADSSRERPGCLTIWLCLIILGNILAIPFYLSIGAPGSVNTKIQSVVSLAMVVFAAAMMLWKRWGFFGLVGMMAINIASGLVLKLPMPMIGLWVVMLALFVYLSREVIPDLE